MQVTRFMQGVLPTGFSKPLRSGLPPSPALLKTLPSDTIRFSGREEDKTALERHLLAAFNASGSDELLAQGWLASVDSPNMDGLNDMEEEYALITRGDARDRDDALILVWDRDHRDALLSKLDALERFVEEKGRPVLAVFMPLPPPRLPG